MATGVFGGMGAMLAGAVSGITSQSFTIGGNQMAGYYPSSTTVWVSWNETYATTGVTAQSVWNAWNTQQTMNQVTYPPQPTAEQINAVMRQNEEYNKRIEAARKRAEEFLLEHLDPEQRADYLRTKMFIVESNKKNRYKLAHGYQPQKLEGDRAVVRYCIHTHGVPREDELLGFKLLLEADEDQFLRTANATRLAA